MRQLLRLGGHVTVQQVAVFKDLVGQVRTRRGQMMRYPRSGGDEVKFPAGARRGFWQPMPSVITHKLLTAYLGTSWFYESSHSAIKCSRINQ